MYTSIKELFDDMISSYISGNDGYYRIKNKFDTQNLDAKRWLDILSSEGYERIKREESDEFGYGPRRALKKLDKIAKNAYIEPGYLLASLFINVFVVRDKTVTETVDGKEFDEISRNPYDFDYGISPDTIQKALEEAWEFDKKKKKPKWEICAVVTKGADDAPLCPNCGGNGFLRCEECGGTGKGEKYVAHTYATGKENTKIGQCPNCFGTGKIKCVVCNGSGKQQVFSDQYQIVKKFEDSKKLRSFACISTTWEEYPERCCSQGNDSDTAYDKFKSDCPDFEAEELKSGINKLYKNQKEIFVDGEQSLQNEISEGYKNLYKKNKKEALQYLGKNDKGELACSVEKHFAIPVYRLYYSAVDDGENKEFSIDIYKLSEKGTACFDEFDFPSIGFFKSLFI
jgi:hypothetical protein